MTVSKRKVGLFIATERGLGVLESLVKEKYNVSNVLALKQQKHESKNVTTETIDFCKKNEIPVVTSDEVKPANYSKYLRPFHPDAVFIISWRFLVPEDCFSVPSKGMFVIHDSLLPKYRGFAPTNWVIINGEKETGLSLIRIGKEIDSGDIIDQKRIRIGKRETANTLNEKLIELYKKMVLNNISSILNNHVPGIPQDHKKATFCCKRTPEDGKLDFSKKTIEIDRLIRGLTYPYPGAYCFYKDKKIFVWDAIIPDDQPKYVGRVPGRVINISKDYADVLTGDGLLRICKISFAENPKKIISPITVFDTITKPLY